MNRGEFVFKAIDILFHPFQNYINKEGVKCVKDIVYNAEYESCKCDIYYKEGATEPMPVVLNVHGGGFVKGDKKHRKSIAHLYADRGWFVVNINYRLSPKYAFPALPYDVITALNFLKVLAEKYSLNLDKVVLTGDSAGAYAATYCVAAAYDDELTKELVQHNVTWSRKDSFCKDQYAVNQPEEYPSVPVKTTVTQLEEPEPSSAFEKFNFAKAVSWND